jgi:hypothetical protein
MFFAIGDTDPRRYLAPAERRGMRTFFRLQVGHASLPSERNGCIIYMLTQQLKLWSFPERGDECSDKVK